MSLVYTTPLLLSVLIVLALGMVAWGFWRDRSPKGNDALMGTQDELLLGLLVLGLFAMGIFVIYLLFSTNF